MDDNYDPKAENEYDQMSEEEELHQHIQQQKSNDSTLAIISLILGICSIGICMGPTTGIPAIICGHIARSKSKKGETGGAGMALAGLITGYIGTFIIFLFFLVYVVGIGAAVMLPSLSMARDSARKISCTNNLKQIGLALRMYSNVYDGEFPPYNGVKGLELLRSEGFMDVPQVYVCPSSDSTAADYGSPLTDETCDYDYIGGLNESVPFNIGLACDKAHNHNNYGNILYIDGAVKGYAGPEWKSNMDPNNSADVKKVFSSQK